MGPERFTPEFKQEAVRQVTERGYSVAEVAARVGVSTHSLYKWVKAIKPDKTDKQASELLEAKSEILRLRAAMRRVEEERDILKKAAVGSTDRRNTLSCNSGCEEELNGTDGQARAFCDAESRIVGKMERRPIAQRDRPGLGQTCRVDTWRSCPTRRYRSHDQATLSPGADAK
jgi:transposase